MSGELFFPEIQGRRSHYSERPEDNSYRVIHDERCPTGKVRVYSSMHQDSRLETQNLLPVVHVCFQIYSHIRQILGIFFMPDSLLGCMGIHVNRI